MRKELPTVRPLLNTYPHLNAALAIALVHEEAYDWFYNKFIQLYSTMSNRFGARGGFVDGWTDAVKCPYIKENVISRKYIRENFRSILDFIIHCINYDCYVYVYLDRFYNEKSEDYQSDHHLHQMLIIGYDTDKQAFIGAEFYGGIYRFEEVSFEGIEKGYKGYEQSSNQQRWMKSEVALFWYKPYQWEFDFEMLIRSFEDYLYERDSTMVFYYTFKAWERTDFKYAMAFYGTLRILIKEENWDIRAFHVLCEHKKMMIMRLEYMKERYGYENRNVFMAYQYMHKEALKVRNYILKHIIKEQLYLKFKLATILDKIEKCERNTLVELITDLKNAFSTYYK